MKIFRNKVTVYVMTMLLASPVEVIFSSASAYIIMPQLAESGPIPEVITPLNIYASFSAKSLATVHRLNLERLQNSFSETFVSGQFKLFTTAEASVGGLGFWLNPSSFGSDDRYLGLCARMIIPESPFRDDIAGHVAAVIDRYGKSIMKEMNNELNLIPEPAVKGVALVFVYGREPIISPAFNQNAEAFALYIKKADLDLFNQYRMTLQTLLNNSEIFMFQGESQIQTLTSFFLQA
jgi:hypothetical protein